jgi:hypothetical protein
MAERTRGVLRTVGVVAAVAGVALTGSAIGSWSDASDVDEQRAGVAARRDEVTEQVDAARAARAEVAPNVEQALSTAEALDEAMAELDQVHFELRTGVGRGPSPDRVLGEAVTRWNAGDRAGAVAHLDAELSGATAAVEEVLTRAAEAERELRRALRRLAEVDR